MANTTDAGTVYTFTFTYKASKDSAWLPESTATVVINGTGTRTSEELPISFIGSGDTFSAVFVTDAVNHALRLSAMGFRVCLLGGEIKSVTEIVLGEDALRMLSKFRFTKGFFGTNGISLTGGFSTPDPREAAVKAAALSACRQSYILADESKFRTESNVRFAHYDDATVITNRVPDGEWKKQDNIITV